MTGYETARAAGGRHSRRVLAIAPDRERLKNFCSSTVRSPIRIRNAAQRTEKSAIWSFHRGTGSAGNVTRISFCSTLPRKQAEYEIRRRKPGALVLIQSGQTLPNRWTWRFAASHAGVSGRALQPGRHLSLSVDQNGTQFGASRRSAIVRILKRFPPSPVNPELMQHIGCARDVSFPPGFACRRFPRRPAPRGDC